MTMPGITAPVAAPGGVDTFGGGISHEISGPVAPRPNNRAKMMVAGIGLLAGALVLAIFVTQQREGQVVEAREISGLDPIEERPPPEEVIKTLTPDPPPPPVADDPPVAKTKRPDIRRPPPPPPPARTITLSFDSNPKGAMVHLEGKQVCVTPCSTKVPKDDAEVLSFVFKKDSYKENTKVVTASRDQELAVSLEKQANVRPTPIIKQPEDRVRPPPPPPPGDSDEKVDDLK
jgi:hypothetical protein